MTWYCRACEQNNPPKLAWRQGCQQHWSAVWTAPKGKRRSRSKSRSANAQASDDMQEAEEDWQMFTNKVPWVTSTPTTRHASKKADTPLTVPSREAGLSQQSPLIPSALMAEEHKLEPLTEEEAKTLSHLRGLRDMKIALTGELGLQLEMLEAKERDSMSSKALSHGHLNRLNKIKSQLTAQAKKISNLDQEWSNFVQSTMKKIALHSDFISAMSRRPHGALQSKTRGPATPEGRVITSLSESPGPATKGTASPGASGDCSADGDHADCIISGRPSDTDGRLGGGRRRGLGDARQPRCRGSPGHQKVQSDSVQRCIISSKGGKSPPEGEERQGEDQRWEGDCRDLMNFSTWISWHNVGQRLADVGCGQDASRSLVYRNSQDCHELSHITRGVEQHDRATRETQEQQLVDTCGDEAPDELTYCSGTGPSTAWCSIHLRFEGDHGHPHDSNNSHDSCALVTGASQQWSTDRAKNNFQCLVKVLKQACEAWDDFWQAPSGWTSSPPLEMSATKATLLRSRREGNLDLPLFQGSHGKESEPLDWSDGTSFARYEPCGYGWMPSDGSSITRSNESFSWISQCDRGGDSDSCSQGYTAIFFRTHQILLKHRMKSVTFRDFVDGHLYQDGQHVTIMLDAVDEEDILRLFWHIDEQIMGLE